MDGRRIWTEFNMDKEVSPFWGSVRYKGADSWPKCFEATFQDGSTWRYTLEQVRGMAEEQPAGYEQRKEAEAAAKAAKAADAAAKRAATRAKGQAPISTSSPVAGRKSGRSRAVASVAEVPHLGGHSMQLHFDYSSVQSLELVLEQLMPGRRSAAEVQRIFDSISVPLLPEQERLHESAVSALARCDLSRSPLVVQPGMARGLLAEVLSGVTNVVDGVAPVSSTAPKDTFLQPIFWRALMRAHGLVHVIVLAVPVDLMDLALPLAVKHAEHAVLAWVPVDYCLGATPARMAFLASLQPPPMAVLEPAAGHGGHILMGLFSSQRVKALILGDECEERGVDRSVVFS